MLIMFEAPQHRANVSRRTPPLFFFSLHILTPGDSMVIISSTVVVGVVQVFGSGIDAIKEPIDPGHLRTEKLE